MRVVHTSLAPNASRRDVSLAQALLSHPSAWQEGNARARLEQALAARLRVELKSVTALDSGRNALRLILETLNLTRNDVVALQAYTCVSVPTPVKWSGGEPLYVDIRHDTFTMDPEDLERKLAEAHTRGKRPRAVILQHTFGLPADMDELLGIAHRYDLVVIEDCAHALGASYRGQPVGTFGDAAVFSFGRDKVISSVFGGALVVRNQKLLEQIRRRTEHLSPPSVFWTLQQLLHPPLTVFVRVCYNAGGKFLLPLLQTLGVLSKALTVQEKAGGPPPWPPSRLPNALATLALDQLRRLDVFQTHRQSLAQHYRESLSDISGIQLPVVSSDRTHAFLRYTIRVKNPGTLHAAARRAGIILGTWYSHIIDPPGTDLQALGYVQGMCPHAEDAARHSVNLPTSPTMGIPEADRVLRVLRTN